MDNESPSECHTARDLDAVWVSRDLLVALGSSDDLEETAHRLLDATCRIPAIDAGAFYLRDPQTGALTLRAHRGLPPHVVAAVSHYPADSPQTQRALHGMPVYRGGPELLSSADVGKELSRLADLRAVAVLPIQHEGQLVAALTLVSHTADQIPTESRRTLEAIAACLGGVVARIQATTTLQESEERFGLLFESAPDAWYLHDLTGIFVDGNRAAEELIGYDRTELIGRSFLSLGLLPPADLLTATKRLALNAHGQPAGPEELAVIRKDGTQIVIEERTFPVRIAGRRLVLGIARDITARKAVEQGLRQRTQQLEALRATSEEIARELDLPTVLDLITRRAAGLVGAAAGTLFLWDAAAEVLIPAAWPGFEAWRAASRFHLGEGVAGTAAARREGLLVNDYRTSPYAHPDGLRQADLTAVLAEPLLSRDELVGVVLVDKRSGGGRFTPADHDLLRLFAIQAAIAIENARLHQAAVHRSAELEALLAATHSVLSGLDLQAILDRIVAEACRISGAAHVKVVLVDREAHALRVGAARGSGQVPGELMPLDRGASGTVARTGQPLFSLHHLSDPHNLYVDQDTKLGLVTYLGLPIKRGAEVLGVLTFNTTTPKDYSPAEVAYLSAFADQAASAIENARLFAAAGEHRDRLLALIRAIGPMTAGLELEATLGQIVSAAAAIARCDHVRLLLVDAATQTLRIPVARGLTEPAGPLPIGTGLSGLVAATGQALYVADTPTDPRNLFSDFDRQTGLRTYLGLPITLRGHVLGVLTFRTTEPRAYPPEEIEYFGLFAAQAAIAIENARLYDAAQRELVERARAEEALQRFSLLADEARDLVLFVGKDGRILDANRAAVAAYGYAREDLLALTISDLRALETQPFTAAQLAQATAEGILFETVHRRRDESTFPVEVSSRGTTMGGELVLLSIIRDITARKQAEAALARRNRHLEAIRAVSEEITHELDLTRLLRLLIARAADLVGAAAATLYLWEPAHGLLMPAAWHGLGDWQGTLQQALGQGIAGTVAQTRQGLCVDDYRTSRYANPVTLQHTQLTASLGEPLLYREELIGAITVSHEGGRRFTEDDQELVRLFATQAAIAIQNARLYDTALRRGAELEALLRASRSLMSGLDVQTILDRIATEAATIAGTPAVRVLLVDTTTGQLRLGAATGATACAFPIPVGIGLSGRVASSGEPLYSPDCQQDPRNVAAAADRAAGIVTYLGLPILSRGAVVGVLTFSTTAPRDYPPEELAYLLSFADQAAIAIENARLFAELHDSYARLQAAQTELIHSEKLRGLGQMAAGIAHDLNNTLAAILGQVELLNLRGVPADMQEHLSTLETAAADGAHVVGRLQDFARQRASLPLVALALPPVVQEALDLTAPRWKDELQRRGHIIQVHVALGALPPILGHSPEIREALTNLIFNAVDAMPEGGVLTVTGTTTPADVCLHVADTGVGMPEPVRQKVFEPFFTTKGVKGTGLGLAVVYGIMERHGGRVDVTSVPGQGTTFTLCFQQAPAAPSETAPDSPPARTVSRCILVIDDDPMVRRTMTELLQAAGQTVLVAESGPAGLAQLDHTLPDLVLTDLGMPEMSGVEVARRVKAVHPRLPVVLLTGWGDTATLPPEDRQVVDRVLGKPIRLAELLRVVAELTGAADSATT